MSDTQPRNHMFRPVTIPRGEYSNALAFASLGIGLMLLNFKQNPSLLESIKSMPEPINETERRLLSTSISMVERLLEDFDYDPLNPPTNASDIINLIQSSKSSLIVSLLAYRDPDRTSVNAPSFSMSPEHGDITIMRTMCMMGKFLDDATDFNVEELSILNDKLANKSD